MMIVQYNLENVNRYSNNFEIYFENILTIQYNWSILSIDSKKIGNEVIKLQENLEIKKYLEENGISQAHVGNRAGINLTKLNLSLNGNRKLTLDEYAKICGVLGVNTDFFLKPRLPEKKEVE